MNKPLNDVIEFHKTYQVPILETPTLPALERQNLRISLIQEELEEIKTAFEHRDMIELVDGLVDLLYVVNGMLLEFGLHNKLMNEGYWDDIEVTKSIVQETNNSSLASIVELEFGVNMLSHAVQHNLGLEVIFMYLFDLIQQIYSAVNDFSFSDVFDECHDEVHRSNLSKLDNEGKPLYNEFGKVIKGPNYTPPNLEPIVNK